MVSSVCRGSYPTMTPHASSPSRKLHIDPAKDYSSPLNVETSVEYDLPAHIYPPKGSEPILMIHPGFVSAAVRARSRAVITPSPTTMVATSGATRPLAPLQQQQGLTNSSRAASRSRSWCSCGNPNCNSNSVKSVNVQNVRNIQNVRNVQSVANIPNAQSVRSVVSSRDVVVINNNSRNSAVLLQKQQQQQQQQERNSTILVDRNSAVLLQQQQPSTVVRTATTLSTTNTAQQLPWGAGGRCTGPCCNPRPAAIAPPQAEFVAPGLPPSLLARTPTRGTAGGSPKLRAARSRRGMSIASSVNLPDYMSTSRSAHRVTGGTTAHSRPRALSTSMGALVATPAPPMAHQHQHMAASLTTSLDLARAHSLTPKSLFPTAQQAGGPQLQSSTMQGLTASLGPSLGTSMVSSLSSGTSMGGGSTSSLLSTVGLSRDSGCSTGGDYPLDWTSDRTRGLVDSGFCTPVDLPVPDDFVTDTLSLPSWKESPTYSSMSGSVPTSSLLPGGASSHHHYLPQPLWNLVY